MALFVLRVAVEGFKKEREVGFYVEKHLTVNCKRSEERRVGKECRL